MICNNNETILNEEESLTFIMKMIHLDDEAIVRRDRFLSDLNNTTITFLDNGILVSCPDIALEEK